MFQCPYHSQKLIQDISRKRKPEKLLIIKIDNYILQICRVSINNPPIIQQQSLKQFNQLILKQQKQIMSIQTYQKGAPNYARRTSTQQDEQAQKSQSMQSKNDKSTRQQQLSQKQKLINQNIKLKTQIYELSAKLDEVMGTQQNRKKKYAIDKQEQQQELKGRMGQLRAEQLEVMSMKNKIHQIKRQLQSSYNKRILLAKQDELKYLKDQLQALQDEKKNIMKLRKQQIRALKQSKTEQQCQEKIQQLKDELFNLRQESKALNDKLLESEKIIRKNHEQYTAKQVKLKQLEQKLLAMQLKSSKRKHLQPISPEMLQKLQEEVSKLEQERKAAEKLWHDKINAIDSELRQKKMQEQKKIMMLKQKQKEMKLNELKIKQLRKLIKWNMRQQTQPALNPTDNVTSRFNSRRFSATQD